MADADGAAPISEWVKLRAFADHNSVVIGRRKSTQRKFSRLVLSLGFRLLIRLVSALFCLHHGAVYSPSSRFR
jgi:hypothetical protein